MRTMTQFSFETFSVPGVLAYQALGRLAALDMSSILTLCEQNLGTGDADEASFGPTGGAAARACSGTAIDALGEQCL